MISVRSAGGLAGGIVQDRRNIEGQHRIRAELAGDASLETREARRARREREIRSLMMREFQRLSYGDGDLEIMPRVLAELLDLSTV
jgi:hypothetical protein